MWEARFKTPFLLLKNMELIALLSSGKGTWTEVSRIIEQGDWEKIILIGDEFSRKFTPKKQFEFVQVNLRNDIISLRDEISSKLKGKIDGLEVALSISSGIGIEHSALISAILNIPLGIRLVSLSDEKLVEL